MEGITPVVFNSLGQEYLGNCLPVPELPFQETSTRTLAQTFLLYGPGKTFRSTKSIHMNFVKKPDLPRGRWNERAQHNERISCAADGFLQKGWLEVQQVIAWTTLGPSHKIASSEAPVKCVSTRTCTSEHTYTHTHIHPPVRHSKRLKLSRDPGCRNVNPLFEDSLGRLRAQHRLLRAQKEKRCRPLAVHTVPATARTGSDCSLKNDQPPSSLSRCLATVAAAQLQARCRIAPLVVLGSDAEVLH